MRNKTRPRYKYILFLVEGKSDAEALETSMGDYFDDINPQYEVKFIVFDEDGQCGGDITSKTGINPDNIAGMVCNYFLDNYLEKQHIYARAVERIIHIVDLDGAFIPDSCIEKGNSPNGNVKTYYEGTRIITDNPEGIIDRNHRKRENILKLLSLDSLFVRQKGDNPDCKKRKIPYSVFFFSSNLDHFLHNEPNLGDMDTREKRNLARQFANGFADDLDGFVAFFTKDPYATQGMSYEDSWKYAQEDTHSLERHTNINLLFEE